jgi:predicted PurR-regulated permease PerM
LATESDTYRLLRPFVILATVTLAVVILYWAKIVFVPLALATLFTFILSPPVVWLRRQGMPRWPAALIITGLACVLVFVVCWIVTLQLRDLFKSLPQHTDTIAKKLADFDEGDDGTIQQLTKMVHDISVQFQKSGLAAQADNGEKPVAVTVVGDRTLSAGLFPTVAQPILEFVVGAILVLVLVVFMLVGREDLQYRLIRLVGHGHLTTATNALYEAADRTSKFLLTQSMINLAFGALVALGLYLLPIEGLLGWFPEGTPRHVPYAFLGGFLAAVLRFIPYAGTWLALLFPLALSVAVFPGWWPPVQVVAFYVLLELTIANFIEPLLLSHSTGISPIALLMAAAFWTWLWGGIGLLLATPLTVCLSVLGRYIPALSFLHTVLGSEPVLDLPNRFYQRLLAQDPDEATAMLEETAKKEPVVALYDQMLIPALVMLRRDSQRGEISSHTVQNTLRTIGEILEELQLNVQSAAAKEGEKKPAAEKRKACVFGCSTGDQAEELALQMLCDLLADAGYEMTMSSSNRLSSEVMNLVEEQKPSVVCIASLPPGGVARASYLCKRLRARFPQMQILVGRWGQDDPESAKERLQAAGANEVTSSLLEARKLLVPLLQHYTACGHLPSASEPNGAETVGQELAVTK